MIDTNSNADRRGVGPLGALVRLLLAVAVFAAPAPAAQARERITTAIDWTVSRTFQRAATTEPERASLDDSLRTACAGYAQGLARDFARDPESHLKQTAALLRLLETRPLAYLDGCQVAFEEASRRYGLEPYWSVVVELARRLSRSPSGETEARLGRLRDRVFGAAAPESRSPGELGILLRAMDGSGYRAYSQSVGFAAGVLSVSDFGRDLYASGAEAEHVLRFAEIYRECAETESRETSTVVRSAELRDRSTVGRLADTCAELLDQIDQALEDAFESAGGSMRFDGRDVTASIAEGFARSPGACLGRSDDPMAKWVSDLEARVACEQARLEEWQAGPRFQPTGSAISSGGGDMNDPYAPHNRTDEDGDESALAASIPDEFLLVPSESNGRTRMEGGAVQTTWEYQNEDDPNHTITVDEYSEQVENEDGEVEWQDRTIVTEEKGLGSSTTTYDDDGNILHYESSLGDEAIHADLHSNGEARSVLVYDGDGHFTISNYDKNGNLVRQSSGRCTDSGCTCLTGCEDPALPPQVIGDSSDGSGTGSGDDDLTYGDGSFGCKGHGCAEYCASNPNDHRCDPHHCSRNPTDPFCHSGPEGGSDEPADPSDFSDGCRNDPSVDLHTALGQAIGDVAPEDVWNDPRWTDPIDAPLDATLDGDSVFGACVAELLALDDEEICGPSAMQCIDPYSATSSCDCGLVSAPFEASARPASDSGLCRYMLCEAGFQCNPASGLCESPMSGDVAPPTTAPSQTPPAISPIDTYVIDDLVEAMLSLDLADPASPDIQQTSTPETVFAESESGPSFDDREETIGSVEPISTTSTPLLGSYSSFRQ